ncbi:MAG: chloride channel protein [Solirubrobacterales bacterium]
MNASTSRDPAQGQDGPDPASVIRSRQFVVLLVLASIVGVIASVVAWGFLELVYYIQTWVYTDIPEGLGFDSAPIWWSLPILAVAGVITAFAIERLPGTGGHEPSDGLSPGTIPPIELPGVILAAFASIGLGMVLGPEAPLMAIGGGVGFITIRALRKDSPPQVGQLLASAGVFASLSFLFGSPIIAAVILIETAGLSRERMPLVVIPGLLAAGIGSLVSIGMASWTGLDSSNISLGSLPLPEFGRPELVDFLWTVPVAAAVAVGTVLIFVLARRVRVQVAKRRTLLMPLSGLVVGGLAIAFAKISGKGFEEVLFSGQDSVGSLVANADSWTLSALALLVAFKGIAYAVSLGGFRGGPVFPALFLGAAAGLMAGQLPGFEMAAAVPLCIGAAVVAVLRLPLSALVLASVLASAAGPDAMPLVIVGVATSYLITLYLDGVSWVRPAIDKAEAS